jgi:hypothetical protein
MKLPDFEFGLNPGTLALGAAVYFLGPVVAPAAKGAFRAVAKSGMKGGMMLYNNGREFVTGTRDYFQQITKEAQQEAKKELSGKK